MLSCSYLEVGFRKISSPRAAFIMRVLQKTRKTILMLVRRLVCLLSKTATGNCYFWVLFQGLLNNTSLQQVIASYRPAVVVDQLSINLVDAHCKVFRYSLVLWLMGEKENNPIPVFLNPVTATAAGKYTPGSAESRLPVAEIGFHTWAKRRWCCCAQRK